MRPRPKYAPGTNGSTEYVIWKQIRNRCLRPACPAYPRYGGRGIVMCERWRDSFHAFLEDMGARPSRQHTIDRINNDGPYAPDNCRWATWSEQQNNRRNTIQLTYQGRTMCLRDWALAVGIKRGTLSARIRHGWSVERVLTKPATSTRPFGEKPRHAILTEDDVRAIRIVSNAPSRELAARYGVSTNTINRVRCRRSWKFVA